MYVNTGFVQVMENMESHYFSFQARQSGKIKVCLVRNLLPVLKQGRNKIHSSYVRKYLKTRMILRNFKSG